MEDDYSTSKRKTGGSDSSGDYEMLIRPMMDRLTALSVSNVTSDARRVLEQFLKLGINQTSTSSNDWKSFVEQEPHYAEVSGVYEDLQPTPYQPMGSEQSLFEKSQSPKSRGHAVLFEKPGISLLEHSQDRYNFSTNASFNESDYVELAANQKVPTAGIDLKEYHYGAREKVLLAVPPVEMKSKGKIKKKSLMHWSSSSSTEDYEYSVNELANRKKKPFLRRAKERLQRTFRHQKKKLNVTTCQSTVESVHKESCMQQSMQLPAIPNSPHKFGLSIGATHLESNRVSRNSSDKSKSNSSSTPVDLNADVWIGAATGEKLKPTLPTMPRSCEHKAKKKSEPKESKASVFEGIQQFFRGSAKLKRKVRKEASTKLQSASYTNLSNITLALVRTENPKLLTSSFRDPDYDSDISTNGVHDSTPSAKTKHTRCRSTVSDQDRQVLRGRMQLDGLIPCMPLPGDNSLASVGRKVALSRKVSGSSTGEVIDYGRTIRHLDETDGGFKMPFGSASSKPFSQKTEKEKDEIYEKIAEQLALIADRYSVESPWSLKTTSGQKDCATNSECDAVSELVPDCQACINSMEPTLPQNMAATDSPPPQQQFAIAADPIVIGLVQSAEMEQSVTFEQIVSSSIGDTTSEPGWQQIAIMFRLTQSAVQMAGMGTAVARQIKELTLKYFEDRFAGWIVRQGGWESMVEETNTESEVD